MMFRLRRRRALRGLAAAGVAVWTWSRLANAGQAQDAVKHHLVRIVGSNFEPAELTVQDGDVVTWRNDDLVPHTASAKDGSWDSGHMDAGASAQIRVTCGLSARYVCAYHPVMKGRVTVNCR